MIHMRRYTQQVARNKYVCARGCDAVNKRRILNYLPLASSLLSPCLKARFYLRSALVRYSVSGAKAVSYARVRIHQQQQLTPLMHACILKFLIFYHILRGSIIIRTYRQRVKCKIEPLATRYTKWKKLELSENTNKLAQQEIRRAWKCQIIQFCKIAQLMEPGNIVTHHTHAIWNENRS